MAYRDKNSKDLSRVRLKARFAELAEQEKVKGHHSPEGRAIRILARALSAWSAGDVSAEDGAVLCHQALEDWLKARSELPAWSDPEFATLTERAVAEGRILPREAYRLKQIHATYSRVRREGARVRHSTFVSMIEFCLRFMERRW